MNLKINWDAFGIATSIACAIHCAILPLILTSLPLFGVEIIDNEWFEYMMIVIAFGVGTYALYHGRKKHHHRWLPLILFYTGMLFLVTKVIFHELQLWLLAPAVTLIVAAHFINYKFCRGHNHAHADDCSHESVI
jgi:hypothetical protein